MDEDEIISVTGSSNGGPSFHENECNGASSASDFKRNSRNLCEKRRRDLFNNLVTELGALVTGRRSKLDKVTVLKRSISLLKTHNEKEKIGQKTERVRAKPLWKPNFLSDEEFEHLVLDATDKFFLFVDGRGNILHASENVISLLGLENTTMEKLNIFDLIHTADYEPVRKALAATQDIRSRNNPVQPIKYSCRIRVSDAPEQFELIDVKGHLKSGHGNGQPLTVLGLASIHQEKFVKDFLTKSETGLLNFGTTQSYDWTFISVDSQAPLVVGFSALELIGTSGYDFYHLDDIEKVAAAHEEVLHSGHATTLPYRFLSKGKQWIWLESQCDISGETATQKTGHIAARHRMLTSKEVIDYQATMANVEGDEECDTCSVGNHTDPGCHKKTSDNNCTSFTGRPQAVPATSHIKPLEITKNNSENISNRNIIQNGEGAQEFRRQQTSSGDSGCSSSENRTPDFPPRDSGSAISSVGSLYLPVPPREVLLPISYQLPFSPVQSSSGFSYGNMMDLYPNIPSVQRVNQQQQQRMAQQAEAARIARVMLANYRYSGVNSRPEAYKRPLHPNVLPSSSMSPSDFYQAQMNAAHFHQTPAYRPMGINHPFSDGRRKIPSFPLAEQQLMYLLEPNTYMDWR